MNDSSAQCEVASSGPRGRTINQLVWLALVGGTLLRIASILFSSAEYRLPFADVYGWPGDHGM